MYKAKKSYYITIFLKFLLMHYHNKRSVSAAMEILVFLL